MKLDLPLKIATIIVVAILLTSSVYVIFFTSEENNGDDDNGNNGEDVDNEPPTIDTITGDTAGKKGEKITISATFSDNINVTTAILYYRTTSADEWRSTSILSGSADISLTSKESVYYYVTVDDAAGNGPVGDPSTDGSVYYTITVSDDGNNGNDKFVHSVFIEEATATWCAPCPQVAAILHDLYETKNYQFYYVSMVHDVNDRAKERLDDYNNLGFPTVYIDGGYKVVFTAEDKSEYENMISAALLRNTPNLHISVNAEFDNATNESTIDIIVENGEKETYTGRLRVYLTEITSRWADYDGNPYNFGFLDYIINQEISIGAGDNEDFHEVRKISDFGFSNLDPENLKIFAVVFNSEKNQGYSDPPDNQEPFDAYYADAVNETDLVLGGNQPPGVGISIPVKEKLHIWGRPTFKTLFGNTILIGKTTITAIAEDDSNIEKVEFYINEKLKSIVTQEPYEWSLKRVSGIKHFRRFTITVKAYDDTGKTATTSIDVISFRL